jgi:futalosine hydrolase
LLIVAAPREVRAVLDVLDPGRAVPDPWKPLKGDGWELVRSGVGKAAAAGATARWYDPARHAGVLSLGLGGSLPNSALRVGDVVLADPSRFADEGVRTPDGFLPLHFLGFSEDAPDTEPDTESRRVLTAVVDRVGPIATVSACSGTDADAEAVAARTGAIAEAMEGAACALAARRTNPGGRFAEVRVISNRTGDRKNQGWDLDGSLGKLTAVLGPILDALGD